MNRCYSPAPFAALFISLLVAPLLLSTGCAGAGEYVADRIEREAKDRARQNTDEAVENSADAIEGGIENAVKCADGDDECIEEAQAEGETVVLTDADGSVRRDAEGDPVTAEAAGQGAVGEANANYDFEAGERTIFAEDFASDNVGDFPRRLEFVKGNWEVVEWQGRRFLRNLGPRHAAFMVPLPETLPERFTVAFDAHFPHGNQRLALATAEPEHRVGRLQDQNYFMLGNNESGLAVRGEGVEGLQPTDDPFTEGVVPVRIMVDGTYAKVYVDQQRVANVPNANLARGDALWFENIYFADAENPMYIGSLRVAAGGRDLYSALESTGRVAVQDIQFDTGEATIKPASAETLAEIAALMNEHPDLKLLVEGHTDDEGDFDANMALSEERAAAVKDALAREHGIDAERLRTTGQGSTQPAASNDSPEGRAENRRVELVKM